MTFRESNAKHLEVLTTAAIYNLPIEVDIYDGASPATMLATLQNARDVAFRPMIDDVGSGGFTLPLNDPKATPAILRVGNVAKFRVGGIYRFGIWMDEPVIIPAAEGSDARWQVSGRGLLAILDRDRLWPIATQGEQPVENVYDFADTGTGLVAILYRIIAESLAKSPSPLGVLATDFDYDSDSLGAMSDAAAVLTMNVGTSSLDAWRQLVGLGMDSRLRYSDLTLQAFEPGSMGVHRDGTTDTTPLVLRAGRHFTVTPELLQRGSQLKTRVIVTGSGGTTVVVIRPDLEADPYIGRREDTLSVNSEDPTTLQAAGTAYLEQLEAQAAALTLPILHGLADGDVMPWRDFDLGDWILVHLPGYVDMAAHRIVGMTITQGETPYDWTCELDLNSVQLEAELRLKRVLDALGGGSAGGGTSVGSVTSASGTGSSGTGKVAVETGDTARFLYEKIGAVAPITKQLAGSSGSRRVDIGLGTLSVDDLADVDVTGIAEDDVLAWDDVEGLLVPRPRGAGGGGGEAEWAGPDPASATIVTPTGTVDWIKSGAHLSARFFGQAASDACAILVPIAGVTSVTVAFRWTGRNNYIMGGPIFTDGVTAGSQALWQMATLPTNSVHFRSGTLTSIGTNIGITDRESRVGLQYMRMTHVAANTWRQEYSPDGVQWTTLGTVDAARTMTPTHIGVAVSSWGNGEPRIVSFEDWIVA